MEDLEAFVLLNMIPQLGPKRLKKLLDHFKEPLKIIQASFDEIQSVEGFGAELAKLIVENCLNLDASKEIERARKNGFKIITLNDSIYPKNLRHIFDPPVVLYVYGELKLEDILSISIVGTRKATPYGKAMSENLAYNLAKKGFTIVSGMARGIDSAAHWGAIEAGGRTIAVLGSGIDYIYPPENISLYKEIAKNGAVITEFPLSTRPKRPNFPRRNRIISGLSLGCVVVEAEEKSGALITADLALEQGKEVFAVPGKINSRLSKGVHALLKEGAKLVESADDVIEEISLDEDLRKFLKEESEFEISNLTPDEREILDLIGADPVQIDEILCTAEIEPQKVFVALLSLELKGHIKHLKGKRYIRM
jgi:DNA processing protein